VLYETAIRRGEAVLASEGPLVARTGQHTGRSPQDKFTVKEPSSDANVHWGSVNRPVSEAHFDTLHRDMLAYVADKELYALDAWGGADPAYRLPVRVVTEFAWHNLFARNMFLPENDPAKRAVHRPEYTVFDCPGFKADPARPRVRTDTAIFVHFGKKAGAHRGHQLRGRDQEVDLHDSQLHAAAQRRPLDALFGERRPGRRFGALLRSVGHRQDHLVERSRTPSHRR
jgi:ATP-dependent phosphoenolpyruvate carboxykinase